MRRWQGAVLRAALLVAVAWTAYWLFSSKSAYYMDAAFTHPSSGEYRQAIDQAVSACGLDMPPPSGMDFSSYYDRSEFPAEPQPVQNPQKVACYHSRLNDWELIHPTGLYSDEALDKVAWIGLLLFAGYAAILLAIAIVYWIALGFESGTRELVMLLRSKRRAVLTGT